jgi:hypothetical protein
METRALQQQRTTAIDRYGVVAGVAACIDKLQLSSNQSDRLPQWVVNSKSQRAIGQRLEGCFEMERLHTSDADAAGSGPLTNIEAANWIARHTPFNHVRGSGMSQHELKASMDSRPT